MRRGEIRLVEFDPARGSETAMRRPAVVVSNDRANASAVRAGRGVITVVPVTSNVERVYPFQVLLTVVDTGLGAPSKAQAERVRSVSIERVGPATGKLPAAVMAQLDDALRLHFDLQA